MNKRGKRIGCSAVGDAVTVFTEGDSLNSVMAGAFGAAGENGPARNC